MRLLWGDSGEPSTTDYKWASVELDAETGLVDHLIIRHLDGAADDGFNVYVDGTLVDTYVDQYPSNTWLLTTFDISSWGFTGLLTIKLEATGLPWGGISTYGQVGISRIELWGEPDTDGDGVIDIDDNCPATYNPGQENNDGDDQGDACDPDDDNDGVLDDVDVCPFVPETLNGVQDDDGCPDIAVTIDIKPGSDPNCINPDGKGVIPVAILTTDTFDAATVDPFTVELAGAGVRVKGKSGNAGSLEDVDGDGDLDLVVQIEDDSVLEGKAEATLTGETFDEIPIEGSDFICIVPPE